MKKSLVVFLVLFIFLGSTLSAYAEAIAPCSVSGVNITANVSFSGSAGTAKVIITKGSMHKVETTMNVQRLYNGSWTTFRSVSGTTSLAASFTASSGMSYRVYVVCKVTDLSTGYVETITRYSSVRTY